MEFPGTIYSFDGEKRRIELNATSLHVHESNKFRSGRYYLSSGGDWLFTEMNEVSNWLKVPEDVQVELSSVVVVSKVHPKVRVTFVLKE